MVSFSSTILLAVLAIIAGSFMTQSGVTGFTINNNHNNNNNNFAASKTSNTALHMTVLTYNGKKKNFKAGSPLKNAVAQLGVKPRYSCKKGDCATCQIFLAGRATKPCVAKVPEEPRLKSLQEKGLEIKM
mmetsp:Transcript_25541/g.60412  ORF Transcript_25541/g.60412 Transcript_25541/m.60412 type:complete len:130 (-) Transcript_25541:295-684(-)|eukprot:CAMPEP_0113498044 /NCGR_PEP_ID=MMETSP0014_2-20120614/30942_1 /TAXON_ID=2857 /ORGANISM="Nitzschia sp." /LENGTH=129 /DNA_ID=CAMNT_0000392001 /DNA_START=223 /DNA_END=612 /DNA_ORIENTATION=+ /assembly_acc=CAM_ASM_000159